MLAWDVSQLGRSLRELFDCFETLHTTGPISTSPNRYRHDHPNQASVVRYGGRFNRVRAFATPDDVTDRVHEFRRVGLLQVQVAGHEITPSVVGVRGRCARCAWSWYNPRATDEKP